MVLKDGLKSFFAVFNIFHETREILKFVQGREFYLVSWVKKG